MNTNKFSPFHNTTNENHEDPPATHTLFTNFPAFKVGSKMGGNSKSKVLIQKVDINKLVERSNLVEVSQIRYPVVKPDELKKMMRSLSMTKRLGTSQSKIFRSAEPNPISSIKENAKVVRFIQKKDFSNKGFSFTESSQNIRIFSPRSSRERKIEPIIDLTAQQEKETKETKVIFSQKVLSSMVKKRSSREKMPLNSVNLIEALHQSNIPKEGNGSQTDRTLNTQPEKYLTFEGSPKFITKTDYMYRIKPAFIESIRERAVTQGGMDRSVSHPEITTQNLFTEQREPVPITRVPSKHTHRTSTEYAKTRKEIPNKTADLSASNARYEYYKKIQNISNPPYWEKWGKTLAKFDEKDRRMRDEKEAQKNKSRDKLRPFVSPFIRYREGMYRNSSPKDDIVRRDSTAREVMRSDVDNELDPEKTEPLFINKLDSRNSHSHPDLALGPAIERKLL